MKTASDSHARLDDDWRLEVDVGGKDSADWLAAVLAAQKLEHDLSLAFQDRIVASQEGSRIFFYAASRDQCESTMTAVEAEVGEQGWTVTTDLRQWHPLAEEWEDPGVPLPDDAVGTNAERAVLIATRAGRNGGERLPRIRGLR